MEKQDQAAEAGSQSVSAPEGWKRREMKGIPASMGALWTQRDEQGWRYGVQLGPEHCNAQGVVHGGVMMTFMDHGLSLLLWEATDRAFCSTVHLDSHFLKAVKAPAFLQLDGEIVKKGRSLIFARGKLLVGGDAVMEASGVWSVARG